MNRRDLLTATSLIAVSSLLPSMAFAQADDLMAAGPLPEMALGSETAPVTVVEYASMTCGHCRNFHLTVWPEIKKTYVDTGKVRFILREFPFDPRAVAAFMLARCVGGDKWYPVVDLLFKTQDQWARAEDARTALQQSMAVTGMSVKQFEACLTDQALLDKITAVADKGKELGVDSTPTLFINGTKYTGTMPIEEFAKIVDPLVAAAGE